ncbi:hypothetical protein DOTSEDRAFT_123382 [Dothistroma septosporum NZE10]|uniref:SWIM-type domain-containing protein n=1 Tax=Dothistroma septosporum (strain NZE10 / CBS 128990) TaxID=675120 RepID=N1PY64_DOTSN|nr:hypothetical protein DOTSEDRAFT_123382 [Dothistroma septosporum NZE10]
MGTITARSQQAASRQIVSALIVAMPGPAESEEPSANPLRDVSSETRNVLLTLYALFEKDFLPALDLLDRGLVTRLKAKDRATSLLLVRSAQQHNNRNPAYEHINHYEVRLDAWSCSCPAFTFAAFPAVGKDVAGNGGDCVVGGLTRGSDMPVCKHLLACVLVEHCETFKHFAVAREASIEEMAGWAAGWGD